MGRISTRVGPSDKRGIPVPRTRHALACVAERELAAIALHGRLCSPSVKVTETKGNPKRKKNIFPSPFLC